MPRMPHQQYVHTALQKRQKEQILDRSLAERNAISHLAARTFLPANSVGGFQSPVQPLWNVTLAVLNRCDTEGSGSRLYFRGYYPWFERTTATTHWDHHHTAWACDLEIPFRPGECGTGMGQQFRRSPTGSIQLTPEEIVAAFDDPAMLAKFPPFLSPERLAELLGLSRATIYLWVQLGHFAPAVYRQGRTIILWRNRAVEVIFNTPDWRITGVRPQIEN